MDSARANIKHVSISQASVEWEVNCTYRACTILPPRSMGTEKRRYGVKSRLRRFGMLRLCGDKVMDGLIIERGFPLSCNGWL